MGMVRQIRIGYAGGMGLHRLGECSLMSRLWMPTRLRFLPIQPLQVFQLPAIVWYCRIKWSIVSREEIFGQIIPSGQRMDRSHDVDMTGVASGVYFIALSHFYRCDFQANYSDTVIHLNMGCSAFLQ